MNLIGRTGQREVHRPRSPRTVVRFPVLMEAMTSTAALFRLLDKTPTLLLDEVDTVFSPRPGDKTEEMRGSSTAGTERASELPCGDPSSDRVRAYEPFGPKVMAGLRELPPTLAHRCFPSTCVGPCEEIGKDFDVDIAEVEATAEGLKQRCEAWAEYAEDDMRDPLRKPGSCPDLTSFASAGSAAAADRRPGGWQLDRRAAWPSSPSGPT